MDNFRPWAMMRRIYYGTGFVTAWVLVGVLVFYLNFYQPPNCFDGQMNGNELGVDAGGDCVRIAESQVVQPNVTWVNSFEIAPGQYNAAAYVENRNIIAGTPELEYTFVFYNNGQVIQEKSGVTALPPNSSYPVFEGRIFTDGVEITDTELILEEPELWLPTVSDVQQFRTVDLNLQDVDERPRLDVTLENTSLSSAREVEVVATIFNDIGLAVTASETFVPNFAPRSTEEIQFTWPNSIAKTVRSCSIPTSVVLGIDLSGSMNNDQANPPQPVTDALLAASSFVENLQSEDKVGVVSFATEAILEQQLTGSHGDVAQLVRNLTIDPASETGFTNTSDAFVTATEELSSERHSVNARRAFVLLTDGLPTAEGDIDAVSLAKEAADTLAFSGADIYAIGLGQQVDRSFVESIASEPSNVYLAPSRSDLDRIYSEITASLCEFGPTKIEVIAKSETDFAPLR